MLWPRRLVLPAEVAGTPLISRAELEALTQVGPPPRTLRCTCPACTLHRPHRRCTLGRTPCTHPAHTLHTHNTHLAPTLHPPCTHPSRMTRCSAPSARWPSSPRSGTAHRAWPPHRAAVLAPPSTSSSAMVLATRRRPHRTHRQGPGGVASAADSRQRKAGAHTPHTTPHSGGVRGAPGKA